MEDNSELSRRALLAGGVATTVAVAGCSGGGTSKTDTAVPTDSPTPTDTPTPTAEPSPTLEEFSYPEGANQGGVDGSTLFSTHRSSIVDAGSVTVEGNVTRTYDDYENSTTWTNRFGSDGTIREAERNSLTETIWSPSGEEVAYVQMDTGFEQRYRINNTSWRPQKVIDLQRFELLLAGAEWGAATEVREIAEDSYSVVYEAKGVGDEQKLLRQIFGQRVTEFTATIAVAASGYVDELSYDLTAEREGGTTREEATVTLDALGETSVGKPPWASTARKKGVQFEMTPTEDNRAVELEMVNGTDVPSGVSVFFSAGRGKFGDTRLTKPVSVGDRLYLGFSESGSVVVGRGEVPNGVTKLDGFGSVSLRDKQFMLFDQDFRL